MTTVDAFLKENQYPHAQFNTALFDEQIDHLCDEALGDFKQVTRQYALFHITFFSLAVLELIALILFFSFLTKTTIFAFTLAGLFLTGFSYFVLLLYFQAKKPNQLLELRRSFVQASSAAIPFEKNSPESHIALSSILERFLTVLHRQEYTYYSLPSSFKTLSPLMQKFSVWTHWKDLHQMKELFLLMIIKEQIELIKLLPTSLEAHAHLANSYLMLSKLYIDPRKLYPEEFHPWVAPEYSTSEMLEKFKKASFRAIEEYKIIAFYAPNDPWVHAQLSIIYCNLDLFQEEMREYEAILKISPNDHEILFRLGSLYFKHGLSAQGLRVYDQLKKNNHAKADELIACYDSVLSEEYPDF